MDRDWQDEEQQENIHSSMLLGFILSILSILLNFFFHPRS
jgi:hypothetical protein